MRYARAFAAVAAASLLSGCLGFHREWAKAQRAFPPPRQDIEGPWTGSWRSGMNDHSGKLRCIVREVGPGRYEFHYWATWGRVLSGGFRIECEAEEEDGEWSFAGDKDLGLLGGKFTHRGTATAEGFEATFRSERGDHGSFELERPEAARPR